MEIEVTEVRVLELRFANANEISNFIFVIEHGKLEAIREDTKEMCRNIVDALRG